MKKILNTYIMFAVLVFTATASVASAQTVSDSLWRFVGDSNLKRIGSLVVGSSSIPQWFISQGSSVGGSTRCINKKTVSDSNSLEEITGSETCLSVNGTSYFNKFTSEISSYVLNRVIAGNTVNAAMNLLGNISGFIVGDSDSIANESILVDGLKRINNNGQFVPRNTTTQRFICANQEGILYPCTQEEVSEVYHWDDSADWSDCTDDGNGILVKKHVVLCKDSNNTSVSDSFCVESGITKPPTESTEGCVVEEPNETYFWDEGNWSSCVATSAGSCTGKYFEEHGKCFQPETNNNIKIDWTGRPFDWDSSVSYNREGSRWSGSSGGMSLDCGLNSRRYYVEHDDHAWNWYAETVSTYDQNGECVPGIMEPDYKGPAYGEVQTTNICSTADTESECNLHAKDSCEWISISNLEKNCSELSSSVCETKTGCTLSQGTGEQTKSVTCRRDSDKKIVDDSYCPGTKPATKQACPVSTTGTTDDELFPIGGDTTSNSGCFIENTKVTLANGKDINIQDIKIGDVLKGKTSNNIVLEYSRPVTNSYLYAFNNKKYFVTDDHPFMTKDGWKSLNPEKSKLLHNLNFELGTLKEGDILVTENGNRTLYKISSQKVLSETQLYNFKLSGDHTYYADGYLVHNKLDQMYCGNDSACKACQATHKDGSYCVWLEGSNRCVLPNGFECN